MAQKMKDVLQELQMENLIPNFEREMIDLDIYLSLTDEQLDRLGVCTLGQKARLSKKVQSELRSQDSDNIGKTDKKVGDIELENTPCSSTQSTALLNQRNLLFGRGKKKSQKRKNACTFGEDDPDQHKKKKVKSKSWTVTVVCLAEKDANQVPTPLEKERLFRAGLGPRKIQFLSTDTEADVLRKISSTDSQEADVVCEDITGFTQLQDCGGFELLQCRQNCRKLTLIDCEWSVKSLKAFLGYQAKLYVRPIQKSLSTESLTSISSDANAEKMQCRICSQFFSIRELRSHIDTCANSTCNDTDGEELPDPKLHVIEKQHVTCTSIKESNEYLSVNDAVTAMPTPESAGTSDAVTAVPITPSESAGTDDAFTATCIPTPSESAGTDEVINMQNIIHIVEIQVEPEESPKCTTTMNVESEDTTLLVHTSCSPNPISEAIQNCINSEITDPVEILRFLQSQIIKGRKLEAGVPDYDSVDDKDSDTNFIIIDRNNVLGTAFEELTSIKDEDFVKTLEVQFYGEVAVDHGSLRKEFFRLALNKIKTKYFDKGLKDHMCDDYVNVGKIMALSIFQNGKMPTFIPEEILKKIFSDVDPESDCLKNIRIGLDKLGIVQVGVLLPIFLHLFRPNRVTLTHRSVIRILEPKFSENGSNSRMYETKVYSAYTKYLREVASGRRGAVSLENILEFATGASEEPVLGFEPSPSIEFHPVRDDLSYVPTANACGNVLKLPRPSPEREMLPDHELFALYDYAFLNAYYGLI